MSHRTAAGPSLGLDIGGTKTRGVLLDARGRVVADRVRPTVPGDEGVVATAAAVAEDCLRAASLRLGDLADAGVGIPGQVDHRTGVVRTAVNLGIDLLPLGSLLGERLSLPVSVDNDVKAAARGAADHLGVGDLSYLNIGTGVAAASIVDGHLVRGQGNLAGEIGHLPVAPDGELCRCGQRGCLEVLAGGGRVAARLAPLAPRVTLSTLVAAAASGDARAAAEAARVSGAIATAVQLVVLAQGAARVVLGGGVVQTATGLVDLVRQVLADRAAGSPFLASLDLPDRVLVLSVDHPVAAIGAALVARADHRSAVRIS